MKRRFSTWLIFTAAATLPAAAAAGGEPPIREGEEIFPPESWHNHASSIVECPSGDLLVCWYHGSGERKADDVAVLGARRRRGEASWSRPFPLADTPGFPDTNPCLLIDPRGKLWLFWQIILANEWHTALPRYRVSSDYQGEGPPRWEEEKELLLKPGDRFLEEVRRVAGEMRRRGAAAGNGLAGVPGAEAWLGRIETMAADKLSRRLGWMTRAHPVVIDGHRLIVPLYSDGFDFSIMALSDDWGASWEASLPLVGPGNVQPSLVRKRDGALAAFMRDNGPPPKRLQYAESSDRGATWGPVSDLTIPNPGSGAEVIRLRDGRWALVGNDTESGRGRLALMLSADEGRTWPWKRLLEPRGEVEAGLSASYPSIIEAADGTLHLSYTRRNEKGSTIYHARVGLSWALGKD